MKVFEGFTNIFKSDDYDDDDYVNEEDYIADDDDDYEVPSRERKAKKDKGREKKGSLFGGFRKSSVEDEEDVSTSYFDDEESGDSYSADRGRDEVHSEHSEPVKSFSAARQPVERTPQPRVETPRERKVVPLRNSSSGGFEVVVIHPESMEDGNEITDTLLSGRAVVLNLEGINPDVAQRIIDYSAGSCYAMRGNLQKISNYIFLVAPSGVDISGDFQRALNPHADLSTYGNDFSFN